MEHHPAAQTSQSEPLDTSKRTIRLLNVLPSITNHDDIIRLELHHADLAEVDGDYDAVSYVWGSDKNMHEVKINGRVVWLRDNIWRFLKHCRDTAFGEKHHRKLYIDAICIDQTNLAERNHQVQLMAQIFRGARRVIAWLGNTSLDSKLHVYADNWAGEWCKALEGYDDTYDLAWDYLYNSETSEHVLPGTFDNIASENDPLYEAAVLVEMRHLYQNPYWSRLWVVQEIILAREAYLVSGTDLAITPSLADVVDSLAHHRCEDPRDHIYGVLGLVANGDRFIVDYSVDLERLFLRALEFPPFGETTETVELLLRGLSLSPGELQVYLTANSTDNQVATMRLSSRHINFHDERSDAYHILGPQLSSRMYGTMDDLETSALQETAALQNHDANQMLADTGDMLRRAQRMLEQIAAQNDKTLVRLLHVSKQLIG
ncbi:hypothetical protein LTR27_009402 [Elasticomyces elasticus]|nr:hypothetical protein LTR27_009402 [Elasticomyces elasticus]